MKTPLSTFLIGLTVCLCAQQEPISVTPVSKNISQNSVTSILQDDDGFLWVGTRYGLNKYLGHSFDVIVNEPGDTTQILSNNITSLAKDQEGNIWVGTSGGGLSVLERGTGNIRTFLHKPEVANCINGNVIDALFIHPEGYIFIGLGQKGLSVYDPKLDKFYNYMHIPNDRFSLSASTVTAINQDAQGNIWVGTWGGGLNLFDFAKGKFYRQAPPASSEEEKHNVIRTLYRSGRRLFMGTDAGLLEVGRRLDTYEFELLPVFGSSFKSSTPVISVLRDRANNMWIGTENDGIHKLDEEGRLLGKVLANNSVWAIYQDRVGTLWFGTYKDGLYKIDRYENRFEHIRNEPNKKNTLSYNIVSAFAEAPNGDLWIGTDGGGLNRYDPITQTFDFFVEGASSRQLPSGAILDLLLDSNENLWGATWKGGVFMKPKGSKEFQRINTNTGLMGDNVYDLLEDDRGNIWISSFRQGINIYNPSTESFRYLALEDIGMDKTRTMLQSSDGRIWLGTESRGLIGISVNDQYKVQSFKHFQKDFKDANSLGDNLITHLYQSDDTTLWIGTEGGGLNRLHLKNDVIDKLTIRSGLVSNIVYGMVEDDEHFLWISTGNGLTKLDLQAKEEPVHYDISDGIQDSEFFKGACYKTNSGELLFGGIKGFNKFHPSAIQVNPHTPDVYIHSIIVNREPIDYRAEQESLQLSHDENDIAFSFTALNYSQPEKNQYKYQLKGFDRYWNIKTGRSEAYYTKIPPGNYEFVVLASNNDGVWNESGASVRLEIKKPWWKTHMALCIYTLAFIYAIYLLRRIQVNRQRLREKLKLEHLEVVKMQELDELKGRFFTNISHEFKTPLTLIIDPLRSLFAGASGEAQKSQYRIIIRNAERLLDLVNRLLDISRLESKIEKLQASEEDLMEVVSPLAFSFSSYSDKHFINFKCAFPDDKVMLYFERDRMEKLVNNLLSNAFKYTPEYGEVVFEINVRENDVQLIVRDSGIGISAEEQEHIFDRFYRVPHSGKSGAGVGLALVKEIVELHRGIIEVESEVDKGSVFTVSLPRGRAHLTDEEVQQSEEVQIDFEKEQEKELMETKNEASAKISRAISLSSEALPLILVAEDNFDMRSYICTYLERKYKIVEADTGLKALEMAGTMIPDLIISDVSMPEIDGYELCERVKSDEKTSHIPVILLTGKSSEESIEKGFSKGADYYITKPFNTTLLELRIFNILKSREQIRNRVLDEHSTDISPKEDTMSPKDKSFMEKVVSSIEENMSNSEFHIDDLCKNMGMSRMQLYRKLKGIVGQSANEFIRTIRLKKAAQLLRKKEYTVAEVTYKVGFTDLHYFRVAFKKQFGVNPSNFREKAN